VVDAEPRERLVGGGLDRRCRQPVARRELADLGRDQHALAQLRPARRQPRADDRFRLAADVAGHPRGIHVGGVDQVAASGHKRVEHGEGAGLVDRPAKHVPAEAEREDLRRQTANRASVEIVRRHRTPE